MKADSSTASSESIRRRIRSFLNLADLYLPSDIRVEDELIGEGFRRSLIRYTCADGDEIEAFFLQPQNGKVQGAVLALHQHNSQWAIGKSEIAGLIGDPLQGFGPVLARRGIAILAPDTIGFESRLTSGSVGSSLAPPLRKPYSSADGWLQYYNQMGHRMVRGDLLMRKILDDNAAALSVLQELTSHSTLGVIGHSLGGIATLFLAALDARVACACSSGAVCSYRHKLTTGTALEMSLVIPGFVEKFDLDDLLRCVAPRSILIVSADADPQSADALDVVRNALPTFEALGCARHLQHLRVQGSHDLDRSRFDAISDWTVEKATAR